MKHNILFTNLFPHIGGAETSLLYLIQNLNKDRFKLYVVVPQPGLFSERLQKINANVLFLNLPGYFNRTLFIPGANGIGIWKFYQLCKKVKPDLIHLNHITQAVYAGFTKRLLDIPTVATSWVNADSIYFYQDLVTQTCIDKILPIHPGLKERMKKHRIIAQNKIIPIFPGIDTTLFRPTEDKKHAKETLGLKQDSLIITIASRFDPTKDHLTFLQAMKIVEKSYSNFTILIAQDPHINLEDTKFSNTTKEMVDSYLRKNPVIKRKTIFIGYQTNMVPIYQATDILVSSSIYESLGIILIEATSCGLPIVTTNFDTQHYVVKDNKSGYLVPIRNPFLLAEKIILLAKNKKLRKKFGMEAREHAVRHFSIKRYVKEIESVYLQLIGKKSR